MAKKPNWKRIKAEYIKGGISQQKLADKYGISYATLRYHIRHGGWNELRAASCQKSDEKLAQKTADLQAETAAKMLRMQSEAALALYAKLLNAVKELGSGPESRVVREEVGAQKVCVDGAEKIVPTKETRVIDLDAVVRSMTALARLYGLDEASKLARERLNQGISPDDTDAFNAGMQTIAALIEHPLPNRDARDEKDGEEQ